MNALNKVARGERTTIVVIALVAAVALVLGVGWPGLVLWTGCFEGCWLLLVVLCPLARVLVG